MDTKLTIGSRSATTKAPHLMNGSLPEGDMCSALLRISTCATKRALFRTDVRERVDRYLKVEAAHAQKHLNGQRIGVILKQNLFDFVGLVQFDIGRPWFRSCKNGSSSSSSISSSSSSSCKYYCKYYYPLVSHYLLIQQLMMLVYDVIELPPSSMEMESVNKTEGILIASEKNK